MNTTAGPPAMQRVLRRAGQLATVLLQSAAEDQIRAGADLLDELLSELDAIGIRPTQPVFAAPIVGPFECNRLTHRHMQTLIGMSQGLSNRQLAADLCVSEEDTIKTHARHLFRKVGACDRAHAVAIAFRHGLLTYGDRATGVQDKEETP